MDFGSEVFVKKSHYLYLNFVLKKTRKNSQLAGWR